MLESKFGERLQKPRCMRLGGTILATTDSIPITLPRKKAHARPDRWADVLVIGAGPTGLACAIEVQKIGLKALVIDKGCLVNSIYNYPTKMTFFTTPELLEIGDIP